MTLKEAMEHYSSTLTTEQIKALRRWEKEMLKLNPVFEITKRDINKIRNV